METNLKSNDNISTKTKSKQLRTQNNRVRLLYVFGVLAFIIPLLHVEAPNTFNESLKVLGFSSWKRLLFAMGFPIAMLFLSTCLFIVRTYIDCEPVKKAILFVSYLTTVFCFFFLTWTVYPHQQDWSKWNYRIASILLSFGFTIAYHYFIKSFSLYSIYLLKEIDVLKSKLTSTKFKIKNLVQGLFELHDPKKEDDMWELLDKNSKK